MLWDPTSFWSVWRNFLAPWVLLWNWQGKPLPWLMCQCKRLPWWPQIFCERGNPHTPTLSTSIPSCILFYHFKSHCCPKWYIDNHPFWYFSSNPTLELSDWTSLRSSNIPSYLPRLLPSLVIYTKAKSESCEAHGFMTIVNERSFLRAAIIIGNTFVWIPYRVYADVVTGCSARFDYEHSHLFFIFLGMCDPNMSVK